MRCVRCLLCLNSLWVMRSSFAIPTVFTRKRSSGSAEILVAKNAPDKKLCGIRGVELVLPGHFIGCLCQGNGLCRILTCPSSSTLCLKGSILNFPRPLIASVSRCPDPDSARETKTGTTRNPQSEPYGARRRVQKPDVAPT